jgi:hypothetical protein
MFNEGTVSAPTDTSAFSFSAHDATGTAASVLSPSQDNAVASGATYTTASLNPYIADRKTKVGKVRRTTRPSDRPALANQFLYNPAFYEARHPLVGTAQSLFPKTRHVGALCPNLQANGSGLSVRIRCSVESRQDDMSSHIPTDYPSSNLTVNSISVYYC